MPETPTRQHGAAAYRRTMTAKQMEAEVFARATRALRDAEAPSAGPLAMARALEDNRRLWTAVHDSVVDPMNGLPSALRAQVASVALAAMRECEAKAPDLTFIAELNDNFAAGLWN